MEEKRSQPELPNFTPGVAIRETTNYRVVMDWKPGLEGKPEGMRFFIEPKNENAEKMLKFASKTHNIDNFNTRQVVVGGQNLERPSLRADFIPENLLPLLQGITEIPDEGKDTIPSPDRMEECLKLHPDSYAFSG